MAKFLAKIKFDRNELLSVDVRTDLGDLGLTQSICPQSEKKNP